MIHKHDYNLTCWWCGNYAESGEHKFKKSDLIRYFGRGPYQGKSSIVRGVVGGALRRVQGPNSDEAKFEKNLCASCNNTRSQPFDRSYDSFAEFIHKYDKKILEERRLYFPDIYGEEWQCEKINLIKYFIKHICCRLAEAHIRISPKVIAFLNDEGPIQHIRFTFEIREDIVAMEKKIREAGIVNGSFWMGDLMYIRSQSTGLLREASSFLGLRWLRINYLYDEDLLVPEDILWVNEIKLSCGYNVEPENILST